MYFIGLVFVLFLPIGRGNGVLCQKVSDEIKIKLPKTEQYKIMKAESFNDKGNALLSNEGKLPDNIKLSDPNLSKEDQKKLDNFYTNRIKASFCFKTANGLIYEVVQKYIKGFWEKYSGDRRPLEGVLKIQTAAYDSLVIADNLRAKAENEPYVDITIPLVTHAEVIEKTALFRLEKVLLIYINWPEKPNMAWLNSNDNNVPKNFVENTSPLKIVPAKKDTLHKASDIYSLLHISENQVDKFNEFLKEKHPDKMQTYLIDFQGLYEDVIDSLHKEWHKYLFSGSVAQDTLTLLLKSLTSPNLNKTIGTNQPLNAKSDTKIVTSTPTATASDKNQKPTANNAVNKPTKDIDPKNTENSTVVASVKSQTQNPVNKSPVNGGNPENKTVLVPPPEKPVSTVNTQSNETAKRKPLAENYQTRLSKKDTIPSAKAKPKQVITPVRDNQGFLFKVQIAACRVKLSKEELKSFYPGHEKVAEIFEDNWFKYSIGAFSSFDEALSLRDKTNVNGIFIAAYLNGKRVKIPLYLKKLANR